MKKIKIVLISIVVILLTTTVVLLNYETEHTVLEDGSSTSKSYSESLSMMLETDVDSGIYEMSSDILWPTSGYTFNDILSSCENGSLLTWNDTNNAVIVSGNVSDKCYIYFDAKEPLYTISEILATKTISTRTDFSVAFTDDTTGIVYETTDNDGITYHWAGDATDNYVYFAGFYWRIVRVNGDGTLRLIYDGTVAHENGEASEDRMIGTSDFNSYSSYSYYVGYTYEEGLQRSSVQNGGTDSTIKTYLDNWYSNSLEGTEYEEYIYQNGKFCNDREVVDGYIWSVDGLDEEEMMYYDIHFVGFERLLEDYEPSLECSNELDVYILNIGLLSADEVSYAGGYTGYTTNYYYLNTGFPFYTMSPAVFYATGGYSIVFYVSSSGKLNAGSNGSDVSASLYVKPVINLNSDILLQGDGTIDNVYTIVMD